jgi:uncharacterized protein YcgI (DUF1989 family)
MAVTELPGPAIRDVVVEAKGVTAFEMRTEQTVRVEDLEGRQAVDLICYNLDNLDEKFWAAHTAKLNGTMYISTGHKLYSDLVRPMMTIIEDTLGVNDVICGSCSYALDAVRYGEDKAAPGCMDLFEEGISPWGLTRKDVPMCFNIFLDYPVQDGGRVALDRDAGSRPGDHIDLRAEMNLLVVITACPQVINPCNAHNPTPIRVAVY